MKKVKFTFLATMVLALVLTGCQGISAPEFKESSTAARAAATESSKRVVGYFCEWGIYAAHDSYYATSIPADKLTHINYAFIGLNESNQSVEIYDPWASTDIVYPGDSWDTEYKGNLGQLRKLKKQYPHLKVLISVGGWTKGHGFHAAAATSSTRARAASNLVKFVVDYGLDGIDIDWEYPGVHRNKDPGDEYDKGCPGGIEDKKNFTYFLKAIREELDKQGAKDGKYYELTAAIGIGYDKIAVTEPGEYSKYLDAINLMAYDMHGAFESTVGHQAPLYANPNCKVYDAEMQEKYNIDWSVKKFISEGVPASKIVIGLPFYSRGWNNVSGGYDFDGDGVSDGMFGKGGSTLAGKWGVGGQSPYFAMKELEKTSGWVKYRDNITKACWLYNRSKKELYTYDDADTIKIKCDYINQNNLGGAMYWEIDGDDWKNGYDLVNIIHESVLNGVVFEENPDIGGSGSGGTPVDPEIPETPVIPEIPETPAATGIPGTPAIEQTTWNGEATFGIKMNMWWGNNGTLAELYENGVLIDSKTFTDNTPSAQSYTFTLSNKANGIYSYKVKLSNSSGSSTSNTVKYTVTKGDAAGDIVVVPEEPEIPEEPEEPETPEIPENPSSAEWGTYVSYTAGDVVSYKGSSYVCLVTHVSYSDTWNPKDAPTLWSKK